MYPRWNRTFAAIGATAVYYMQRSYNASRIYYSNGATVRDLLLPIAVLACPIGMGLMMLFMGRGMFGSAKRQQARHDAGGDLASLKAEAARLDARIEKIQAQPTETARS